MRESDAYFKAMRKALKKIGWDDRRIDSATVGEVAKAFDELRLPLSVTKSSGEITSKSLGSVVQRPHVLENPWPAIARRNAAATRQPAPVPTSTAPPTPRDRIDKALSSLVPPEVKLEKDVADAIRSQANTPAFRGKIADAVASAVEASVLQTKFAGLGDRIRGLLEQASTTKTMLGPGGPRSQSMEGQSLRLAEQPARGVGAGTTLDAIGKQFQPAPPPVPEPTARDQERSAGGRLGSTMAGLARRRGMPA